MTVLIIFTPSKNALELQIEVVKMLIIGLYIYTVCVLSLLTFMIVLMT